MNRQKDRAGSHRPLDNSLMFSKLLAQGLSGGERYDAVHEHFATRSYEEALQVILVALLVAIGLCAILLLSYRTQERHRRHHDIDAGRRRKRITSQRQPLSARKRSRNEFPRR
jgi:hypothetical protein